MTKLHELASLIRSKNAGPFDLTFDIMFEDQDSFRRCRMPDVFNAAALAPLLRVPEEKIKVFFSEAARAIKISIPRPVAQGDFGDSDGHGGQQYAALLDIDVR